MRVQVTFAATMNMIIEVVAGHIAKGYGKRIEMRTVKRWLRDAFEKNGYGWDWATDLGLPQPSDEDYDKAISKLRRIGLLPPGEEEEA